MDNFTEERLIEGVRNRDRRVLQFIVEEYFPSVKYHINTNHGNNEEARDIFNDAIVITYHKLQGNKLKLNCSLRTYIFAVCRNLWLKKLKRKKRAPVMRVENPESMVNEIQVIDNQPVIDEMKSALFQKHFLKLNSPCRRILALYLARVSFEEMARMLGFTDQQYARKKKYRCLQMLIKSIQNDPEYKTLIDNENQV